MTRSLWIPVSGHRTNGGLEALLRPDPATTLTMDEPFFDEQPPPSILDAITIPPSVDASVHGPEHSGVPQSDLNKALAQNSSVISDQVENSSGLLNQEPVDTQVTMKRLDVHGSSSAVAQEDGGEKKDADTAFEMRAAPAQPVARPDPADRHREL